MLEIFYFEGNSIKKGSSTEISNLKNKKIWIDATNITKQEADLLGKQFNLHPLTMEDIFHSHVRVKIEEFDNYLFCVLCGINENKKVVTTEIDFVLGNNFLITSHKTPRKTHESLKNSKHRLHDLFQKGVPYIFHHLIDYEIDYYFPEIDNLNDIIEELEEKAMRDPSKETMSDILLVRKGINSVRKIVTSQREVLSALAREQYKKHISKDLYPYFRDVYDHAIRVSESVESSREAIGNAFEVYMSSMSNNMNNVMKTLSVFATIALPLTVISGIYGTNFRNIPGLYSDYGFFIMLFVMILMIASMLYMFKRKNWF